VFSVVSTRAPRARRLKNLIFASTAKPDIRAVLHLAVLHLAVLAGTAGHHDDVRVRHVGQPRLGRQDQAAHLVTDRPGTLGDERDPGARQPAEHLVRADRVEHGEAVKEQDGDLHDSP
jgi:hypothetical protein